MKIINETSLQYFDSMGKQEEIEEIATAISNSCDKHGFDLLECEIDLIALDVMERGIGNKQNIFNSINNRLSLYYPHGAIPYDVFFDVLQDVAKENGIEIE